MTVSRPICLVILCTLLLLPALAVPASSQTLSPVQEQEYLDAQEALQTARRVQAEKYAADPLKKATDYLAQADRLRTAKDSDSFTQATRLARAYAEVAEAQAELNREKETLAATQEELTKVKAEIDQLRKR